MFYFEKINGKSVMKSDLLKGLTHFFTTRESIIKTKEPEFENLVNENKKMKFSTYNPKTSLLHHKPILQILKQPKSAK